MAKMLRFEKTRCFMGETTEAAIPFCSGSEPPPFFILVFLMGFFGYCVFLTMFGIFFFFPWTF